MCNYKKLPTLNWFTLFYSTDSGHFVHRPLCAAGSGEHHLSGGLLHAAPLSFPGASLRQGLKNTVELHGDHITDVYNLRQTRPGERPASCGNRLQNASQTQAAGEPVFSTWPTVCWLLTVYAQLKVTVFIYILSHLIHKMKTMFLFDMCKAPK